MQTGNGEDLMTLEQEITELQRENARVESQMMRLKSDINAMETHLSHGDRVSNILNLLKDGTKVRHSSHFTNYSFLFLFQILGFSASQNRTNHELKKLHSSHEKC